jgi:quinolinate synthase
MTLYSVPLPEEYRIYSEDELRLRILAEKKRLGKRLMLLTHHYQRYEIVGLGDRAGDSYGLSKIAAGSPESEYIVFCGVRFMAESARILCRPEQKVYLPNRLAGCPMADMAPSEPVQEAWELITEIIGKGTIVPISYMNSSSELKAFTGRNGGLICTSSNADKAFNWAFDRFEKLLFFPDQHLGRNTAKRLGITPDQIALIGPKEISNGFDREKIKHAKVILWYGYCYVHNKFTLDHIREWREREPQVKIVVHPECIEEVVDNADAVGSTAFIVKYVENAPPGSIIAIGTELNLIHRLAMIHTDKQIFELSGDACPICSNMFRTSLADLCYNLENIDSVEQITVPDDIMDDARLALERMLEIGG